MERNCTLAERTLLVGYEDFCQSSGSWATRLLDHCGLPEDQDFSQWAQTKVRAQKYYQPEFTAQELARIEEITAPALQRLEPFAGRKSGGFIPVALADPGAIGMTASLQH